MSAKIPKIIWLSFLLLVFTTSELYGQTEIAPANQATMMFELDVKAIRESAAVQAYGLDRLAKQLRLDKRQTGIAPERINRLEALFRFPDNANEIAEMRPGDSLPVQFFWAVELDSPPDELRDQWEELFDEVEENGRTYFKTDLPDILLRIDGNTIFAATENYLFSTPDQIGSERLMSAASRLPEKQTFKAAIDIQGARPFLQSLLGLDPYGLQSFLIPQEALPFIRYHQNLGEFALSANLEKSQLLSVFAKSGTLEQAIRFEKDFAQILNIGRVAGMLLMGEAGIEDKRSLDNFAAVLKQLKPIRNQLETRLEISQPDGFDVFLATVVQQVNQRARETDKLNRFRRVGLSVHNFFDSYRKLPFRGLDTDQFSENLSWRAIVCRFMGFNLGINYREAWDSESNKAIGLRMPDLFGNQDMKSDIAWIESDVESLEGIPDGTANTIMFMEVSQDTPWTQPNDVSLLEALKIFKALDDGERLAIVMYDSSVHMIDNRLNHNEFKALLTPDGNEHIDILELLNR